MAIDIFAHYNRRAEQSLNSVAVLLDGYLRVIISGLG
jgi:hypothetical protein